MYETSKKQNIINKTRSRSSLLMMWQQTGASEEVCSVQSQRMHSDVKQSGSFEEEEESSALQAHYLISG